MRSRSISIDNAECRRGSKCRDQRLDKKGPWSTILGQHQKARFTAA